MILTENIKHQYDVWMGDEKSARTALDGVSLDVKEGEFVAILGANGSGKSTLAKHLNVLLLPDEGAVWIDGMDASDEKNLWAVRTTVGMVFQNPDNQIVGTSVEEDVAFGPENRNIESVIIQEKVANSLDAVGLLSKRKVSPYRLSGGQKQRVAVAGVLAMDTKCIVLDEPTAMLDPASRKSLMDIVEELHRLGKTIILITHHSDEVVHADRIILMDKGRIRANASPAEIFAREDLLAEVGMEMPPIARIASRLRKAGVIDEEGVLERDELLDLLSAKCSKKTSVSKGDTARADEPGASDAVIEVRNLSYTYAKGTINEIKVLEDISFEIHEGECVGLIGTSGAGKTTLLKNLNGLLKAESGDVLYRGESIYRRGYKLADLRKSVGLVFQNAETQLFCKTVLEDVAFGLRRMKVPEEEALERAKKSLKIVGIDEEYFAASPMDLSGGQKRRVAIAGVIVMEPSVLVLDEPAAGLDPGMKAEVFGMIDNIRREKGTAVVLVSHEMEDVANYADRVMLLSGGRIKVQGSAVEVFSQVEKLRALGADVPAATDLMYELKKRGADFEPLEVNTDAAADAIIALAGGKAQ